MSRIVKATIQGTAPILLHNPQQMNTQSDGKKKIPTPAEEALIGCYWTDDKHLGFPAINIHRSMVSAAGAFRAGKLSMTPYIAGGIEVQPEIVPFYTLNDKGKKEPITEYLIDTRRAVVQRQGIMRSRARIPKGWMLTFEITVSEEDLPQKTSLDMLKAILAEAGRRIGIGDFRPQKTGPFGKFVVIEWNEGTSTGVAAAA
jgi:hypothetical protein